MSISKTLYVLLLLCLWTALTETYYSTEYGFQRNKILRMTLLNWFLASGIGSVFSFHKT